MSPFVAAIAIVVFSIACLSVADRSRTHSRAVQGSLWALLLLSTWRPA